MDDNEFWLCCGNVNEQDNHWRVYLNRKAKSLFGRNKAPVEAATPLLEALSELLSESEGIEDIRWSQDYA